MPGDERRFDITQAQVIQLQRYTARQVKVSNMLPRWLYLRTGGTDIPTGANCDIAIPPMTEMTEPISATSIVSVGLGVPIVTLGQQVESNKAIVTFYDTAQPGAVGSIDLNPTRMGNMAQQKFVVAGSYTIQFPVTMVHVSNYSQAWVYAKLGSLVIPTAATADITLPPMSEKSLTCLPSTQFAFGLSANLVTMGQQIPAGVNIIATFYEYPTPVTIGTADLNPSKLGKSVSASVTANSMIDPAFPIAQINISNYLRNWIYATYGQVNRLLNPEMEIWIAGALTDWATFFGSGGTVTPGVPYRYLSSALITHGGILGTDAISQRFNSTPAESLTFSLWYMTDGITAPFYYVYDVTNAAFIIGVTALATPTNYTPFRVDFIVPAGCVTIEIAFGITGLAPGAQAWIDTTCIQLTTTAANAQIAVPPLSEKSITLPPSTHVDVVVGTQTVMVATGVPITSALFTCYEYAVPTNLGVAPLSPGGFRYAELIRDTAVYAWAALVPWTRDLSNFNRARYTLQWVHALSVPTNCSIQVRANRTVGNGTIAIIPFIGSETIIMEFQAGTSITFYYDTCGPDGGVGMNQIRITKELLEAW